MEGVELITVGEVQARDEYYLQLERGNILFFPRTPFELPEDERNVLRATGLSTSSHHKNIAYRPASDKVTGFDKAMVQDAEELRGVMRAYSQRVLGFLRAFLPRYMENCRIDFASFRPQEEEGRELPTKKRNDLLHVDAFPSRPTRGGRILRVFTNLNTTRPRVWTTTESFDALARQYAKAAGLQQIAEDDSFLGRTVQSLGAKLGIGTMSRTPYDMFMLRFHDYLKENSAFQADCPKIRMEFPPLATWVVFTDGVAHAALSGQYAVEQTFLIPPNALVAPEAAPFRILEGIAGRPLVS